MSFKNTYFASANSKDGFVGFFDQVFGPVSYRYILKGGPGTGKSSLMRQLGAAAEEAGHTTEYILCSSDPSSLDGVIINDLGIAMLDGTAPHVCDVNLPGVDSEIVNLGVYWNKKKLAAHADAIREQSAEKASLYQKAYRTLAAIGEMETLTEQSTHGAFDTEKAAAFASRFASRYTPHTIGHESVRLIDGYGMDGYTHLESFESELNYKIRPCLLLEYRLLGLIYQALRRRHPNMLVSYRALDGVTVNGILLPDEGISVTVGCVEKPNDKQINTERFVDKRALSEHKNKLRFSKKCREELEVQCTELFAQIKDLHFSLETIYGTAMNFKKLSQESDRLITKILS